MDVVGVYVLQGPRWHALFVNPFMLICSHNFVSNHMQMFDDF